MGLNAVLPPRTSWGFQFQTNSAASKDVAPDASAIVPTAQNFAPATNSLSTNSAALHFSNLFVSKPAVKRKHSMDDSDDDNLDGSNTDESDDNDDSSVTALSYHTMSLPMNNSNIRRSSALTKQASNINSNTSSSSKFNSTTRTHNPSFNNSAPLKVNKRARFQRVVGRSLPVSRLVETLDKKALEALITSLVQARPDLTQHVLSLAPTVTINTALEALREKLEQIYHGLPYKGDQSGDYAYLRVKPGIEDFLNSLTDYTSHFLPPNEQQPSNSLAFLDAATMLLHRLPQWQTPENNHSKQVAYDRISEAWVLALQEASRRANGLGLAYGGWQHKLSQHNEMSNGLLTSAVNCLKCELRWLNNQNQSSGLFWGSNMSETSANNTTGTNDSNNNTNNGNGTGHMFGQSSFPVSVRSWK